MRITIVFLTFIFSITVSQANGLRGGEISVKQTNGLTCEIALTGYTDLGGLARFGGGTVNFGDGQTTIVGFTDQEILYGEVGRVRFKFNHTYAAKGFYKVSYTQFSLDQGIVNMVLSLETPFYMESGFILDPARPNFSFPAFGRLPIFFANTQEAFSSSMAVTDNNHLYYYSLGSPNNAQNYSLPDGFSLNSTTGLVNWPASYTATATTGEYFFSVSIYQYDLDGNWQGYITRQFQVILLNKLSRLQTQNAISDANGKVTVSLDQQFSTRIVAQDSSAFDSVRWVLYVDSTLSKNVSLVQYDSVTSRRKFRVGILTFKTNATNLRDAPYSVIARATSYYPDIVGWYQQDVSFLYFTKTDPAPVLITGLPVTGERSVQAFPNPFGNSIYMEGLQNASGMIQLLDISGKPVLSGTTENMSSINTSSLPPGVYLLIIQQGSSVEKIKMIKK